MPFPTTLGLTTQWLYSATAASGSGRGGISKFRCSAPYRDPLSAGFNSAAYSNAIFKLCPRYTTPMAQIDRTRGSNSLQDAWTNSGSGNIGHPAFPGEHRPPPELAPGAPTRLMRHQRVGHSGAKRHITPFVLRLIAKEGQKRQTTNSEPANRNPTRLHGRLLRRGTGMATGLFVRPCALRRAACKASCPKQRMSGSAQANRRDRREPTQDGGLGTQPHMRGQSTPKPGHPPAARRTGEASNPGPTGQRAKHKGVTVFVQKITNFGATKQRLLTNLQTTTPLASQADVFCFQETHLLGE